MNFNFSNIIKELDVIQKEWENIHAVDQERVTALNQAITDVVLKNPISPILRLESIWKDLQKNLSESNQRIYQVVNQELDNPSSLQRGIYKSELIWEQVNSPLDEKSEDLVPQHLHQLIDSQIKNIRNTLKEAVMALENKEHRPFLPLEKEGYTEIMNRNLRLYPKTRDDIPVIKEVLVDLLSDHPSFSLKKCSQELAEDIQLLYLMYKRPELSVTPSLQVSFRHLFTELIQERLKEINSLTEEEIMGQYPPLGEEANLVCPPHEKLLKLLIARYHKAHKEGLCHGLALMAEQAFLLERLDEFALRLNKITLLIALHEYSHSNQPDQEGQELDLREIIETLEDERDFDSLAFLEGIELCMQGGYVYDELFEQEIASQEDLTFTSQMMTLIANKDFEEKGDWIRLALITGVCKACDLKPYLESLQTVIDENSPVKGRLGLKIVMKNHAISVGYDPINKKWYCEDANQKLKRGQQRQEVVEYIREAFLFLGYSPLTPFSIDINIVSNDVENINSWGKKIATWQTSEIFTEIQKISSESSERNSLWLLSAANHGQVELVDALLEAGAQISIKTPTGDTPLLFAANHGYTKIVKTLLRYNVDANEAHPTLGITALMCAAQNGHLETIKVLMEANQTLINEKNPINHMTPLMYATIKGHVEVLEYLIEAGALINEKADDGSTALSIAVANNHAKAFKVLLKSGSLVDEQLAKLPVYLSIAVRNRNIELIQALIEAGADINQKLPRGRTFLMIAVRCGYKEIVNFLIQAGAQVNEKDQAGMTALQYAQLQQNREMIELLSLK